jgi:hypothetical protein
MHPQIELEHGDVGPQPAHLLLASSPDLLDVVEVLLDRGAVGKRFQDLGQLIVVSGQGTSRAQVVRAWGSSHAVMRQSCLSGRS